MDMIPEVYGGDVGITALQFACGSCDVTGAANNGIELFNPALTGTAQLLNAKLITVTGIIVWGAQAAAVNVDIWNTTNAALVGTAATIPAQWMDHRRSIQVAGGQTADAPIGVLKQGNLASVAAGFDANTTQMFREVLAASQLIPFKLPWNQDISPGTGMLVTVANAAAVRSVVSLIWIERAQTS